MECTCENCKKIFITKLSHQKYCREADCQRARKRISCALRVKQIAQKTVHSDDTIVRSDDTTLATITQLKQTVATIEADKASLQEANAKLQETNVLLKKIAQKYERKFSAIHGRYLFDKEIGDI